MTAPVGEAVPPQPDLEALDRRVRNVLSVGEPAVSEDMLAEVVDRVEIDGHDLHPWFRLPNGR